MKKLNELRQQRAKLNERNTDLIAMMEKHPDDTDKRPGKLTDEQITSEYEANETQIKALDAEISALEAKQKVWADRRAATADNQRRYGASAGVAVPVTTATDPEEEEDEEEGGAGGAKVGGGKSQTVIRVRPPAPGIRMAQVLRAVGALSIGKRDIAMKILEDHPQVRTAMEASNFSAGGAWIPENYVAEMIELLRPISVVMSMGVTQMPLVNGTLTLPKITGGATAAYIGESVNIPISQLTGGQVKAAAHKLAVMVPMSNDLLRYAVPSADITVRNDMVRAAAQTRDAAQIRDDGTGNAPKGLRYWAPAGQVETMTATPDLTKVDKDLNLLITNLLAANVFSIPRQNGVPPQSDVVGMNSVGWLMSPRTWSYLMTLRDGNGNRAYPEMNDGLLKGFPYAVTSLIPENLGGGSNETEVYFAAFSDVIIAQDPRVEVEISNVAAYHDGSNVQAAFSLDQTVIRLIMNDDLIVRHPEAVSVLTGVTWT